MIKHFANSTLIYTNNFNGTALLKVIKDGDFVIYNVSDGDFRRHNIGEEETNWCYKNIRDSESLISGVIRKGVNHLDAHDGNTSDLNNILCLYLNPWNVPIVRCAVKSIYKKRKKEWRDHWTD